ncbi:hypothetical protein MKW94_022546, partial [Papaver nudicaule]|nr:hypothetical protein [Papaver nudicaule]
MVAEAVKATQDLSGVAEADKVLTRTNYQNWKRYMKNFLLSQNLWRVVDGNTLMYHYGYEDRDKIINYLSGVNCARDLWNALRELMEPDGRGRYLWYSRLLRAVQKYGFRKIQRDRNGSQLWEGAHNYFEKYPDDVVARITEDGSTALHVAVGLGKVDYVKELLKLMTPEQLETKARRGETALSMASAGNNLEIVGMMLEKNPRLLVIENRDGHIPLVTSASSAGEEMLYYLFKVTPKGNFQDMSDRCVATILTAAVRVDAYDIVLEILERGLRYSIVPDDDGLSLLTVMAGRPSAFPSGNQLGYFQRWIYRLVPGLKQPLDDKVKYYKTLRIVDMVSELLMNMNPTALREAGIFEAINRATIHGIVELFDSLAASNPSMLHFEDDDGRSLIQIATLRRQENIFRYISQLGQMYQNINSRDRDGNNILHSAGSWMPSPQLDKVPGAALQMQREIQWYQ